MTDRTYLRLGAGAAIAGGACSIVFGILHAGPRRGDTRLFLTDIADSRIWVPAHLGLAAGFLLLLAGMAVITKSISGDPGAAWARLAWPIAVVGIATALVNVALDGPVMKEVADRWAAGDTDLFAAADVLRQVDVFGFTLWTIVLVGVVPVLYGVAIVTGDGLPAWLGWVAIGSGALGLVTGVLQWFLGLFRLAVFVLHPTASGVLALWAVAVGILLWRRSS